MQEMQDVPTLLTEYQSFFHRARLFARFLFLSRWFWRLECSRLRAAIAAIAPMWSPR